MGHVRGAPYHPQTQGKTERWHQTLKNRILLENYFFPADLKAQIETFVDHYNHRRYHESINNLTPADVYFGCGQTILILHERIELGRVGQGAGAVGTQRFLSGQERQGLEGQFRFPVAARQSGQAD